MVWNSNVKTVKITTRLPNTITTKMPKTTWNLAKGKPWLALEWPSLEQYCEGGACPTLEIPYITIAGNCDSYISTSGQYGIKLNFKLL